MKPSRIAMIDAINAAADNLAEAVEQKSVEPSAINEVKALRAAAQLLRTIPAGPPKLGPLPFLEVAAHPLNAGKHPVHDWRYLVTADTKLEHTDNPPAVWCQNMAGAIVAQLNDTERQREYAFCLAAAPELLEACTYARDAIQQEKTLQAERGESVAAALGIAEGKIINAIAKAKPPDPLPF